jgi:hypothetical protein
MQVETFLMLISTMLFISGLSFHLTNIGMPFNIKAYNSGVHSEIANAFFEDRKINEFGNESNTDVDYNDVLFLRIIDKFKVINVSENQTSNNEYD